MRPFDVDKCAPTLTEYSLLFQLSSCCAQVGIVHLLLKLYNVFFNISKNILFMLTEKMANHMRYSFNTLYNPLSFRDARITQKQNLVFYSATPCIFQQILQRTMKFHTVLRNRWLVANQRPIFQVRGAFINNVG